MCRRYSSASMFGVSPPALPCPGSVGQQPAALLDAFALLDSWAKDG